MQELITTPQRLLNIRELSEYLGVSINTIYCWVNKGFIPRIKLGRLVKFDINEINSWLDEKKWPKMK